jgi:maltose alpha-D-glucosyltransferase/alpha-amylase
VIGATPLFPEGIDGRPDVRPDLPPDVREYLNFFILEKALYELEYERNNRPDWAGIPIRGLRALAV